MIIVEGIDDIDFLRHVCIDGVIIRESYSGKLGVYKILEHFTDKASVIGICDRDYDISDPPLNIFLYDFSCLEMMLISSESAVKKLFTQLHLPNSISREQILKQLCWISCLRRLNYVEDLNICFDGLRISKLFDNNSGINLDKLISELCRINNNPSLISEDRISYLNQQSYHAHNISELLWITQGHDFLNLVQCHHSFNATSKRKIMDVEAIRGMLYCAYTIDDFRASFLKRVIFAYEKNTNVTFFIN
ncbi:MAG: DUF4435 domain-containing protein [Oscillospiraceae bacterium]|nr:DUF4435 domain-containing protein [Oscillospiraceae bacterium]